MSAREIAGLILDTEENGSFFSRQARGSRTVSLDVAGERDWRAL
jgi:hypothetical protein